METIRHSLLVCAYCNHDQFINFLLSACAQDVNNGYEIVVVDNGSTPPLYDICKDVSAWTGYPHIIYERIDRRTCSNITQGINIAAKIASGRHRLTIIADSNVLLASNFIRSIERHPGVVISGAGVDVKISPEGSINCEYAPHDPRKAAEQNARLLKQMGWPDDPLNLQLIPGKHRLPDPHNNYDVYAISMPRNKFVPYDTKNTVWGTYHADYVKAMCRDGFSRLSGTRIIHQFHRVWKSQEAT